MKFKNNYNSQTLFVGKVLYKRPDDELRYYTVIKSHHAPDNMNELTANKIFATRGGNLISLHVVKAFDQKRFTVSYFKYESEIIIINYFATAPKEDINFYILQFIGYNGFCTEVVKASSLKQAKKTMFSICHTAILANVIIARITHTENL
jgi:hypothetical protein